MDKILRKLLWLYKINKNIKIIGKEKYKIRENNQNFKIRKGTSDFNVVLDIFGTNSYKINCNFKPKFIIDAGANIGISSLYFNMKYPEASIIAIESEKSNYKLLCENISEIKNIKPINAGLWNKNGFIEVKDIGLDKWGFIVQDTDGNNPNKITAITIDKIIELYNIDKIDILKIDIEGSEKEVFENSNWLDRVDILIIELHDRMKKGCSQSVLNSVMKFDFSLQINGENLIFIKNKLIAEENGIKY